MLQLFNMLEGNPVRLLDQRFHDMQSMSEAVGWNTRFRQLEPGLLCATALLMGNRSALVMRVSFDRAFHQLGTPPAGFWTFGLTNAPLRLRGANVEPGVLINFSGPDQLDMTSHGPSSGYVLSFAPQTITAAAGLMHVNADMDEVVNSSGFWSPDEHQRRALLELLEPLVQAAQTEDGVGLREHRGTFDFELAVRVVQIISEPIMLPSPDTSEFRRKALKRALEMIDQKSLSDITIGDLCRQCHASWATLERAFVDEFGVGPKAYLQARRLAAVNRELVQQSGITRISEVANSWGFWHMGNFAATYRKQFGELPTETAARAPA